MSSVKTLPSITESRYFLPEAAKEKVVKLHTWCKRLKQIVCDQNSYWLFPAATWEFDQSLPLYLANCPPGLRRWHSHQPLLEVLQLPKLDFRSPTCAIVFGSVASQRKVIEGGTRSGCTAPVCYPIGHFTVLYFLFFKHSREFCSFNSVYVCVCNGVTQPVVHVVMLSAMVMRSQCCLFFIEHQVALFHVLKVKCCFSGSCRFCWWFRYCSALVLPHGAEQRPVQLLSADDWPVMGRLQWVTLVGFGSCLVTVLNQVFRTALPFSGCYLKGTFA